MSSIYHKRTKCQSFFFLIWYKYCHQNQNATHKRNVDLGVPNCPTFCSKRVCFYYLWLTFFIDSISRALKWPVYWSQKILAFKNKITIGNFWWGNLGQNCPKLPHFNVKYLTQNIFNIKSLVSISFLLKHLWE